MSANRDSLIRTRNNLIAGLETESENPSPSYNIDGQSFDWNGYYKFMVEKISTLKLMIDSEDDNDIVEEETLGLT